MTRGKVQDQNLMLVSGRPAAQFNPVGAMQTQTVTALKSTTAFKPEAGIAPAAFTAAELDPIPSPPPAKDARPAARRSPDEGLHRRPVHRVPNFTMVRNGTCLKCDTCGTTTGCS